MQEDNTLPYLADIIDISQFRKGRANIIIAPCHSGKTTAAKEKISKLATGSSKVLYLIDTAAGKSALSREDGFRKVSNEWLKLIPLELDSWWGEPLYGSGFRVMTYHQLGYVLMQEPNLMDYIDVVICDEMHNFIKFWNMERSEKNKNTVKPCERALSEIVRISKKEKDVPYVVIMSATVNNVSTLLDKRNVPVEYYDYCGKVHYDKTEKTVYYSEIEDVLKNLDKDRKTFVFVPGIKAMKKYAEIINDGTRKICCLWSTHNEEKMNDEQLDVRNEIINKRKIPDNIDVLFINAAYETSLNITNEDFNTIVIHSGSSDTRTQVRGRLRHDIEKQYIYDKEHEHVLSYFPEEYYDIPLCSKEMNEIVEIMNLKDEKGNQKKWPSIRKSLINDGAIINNIRTNKTRFCVVHKPA